MPLAIASGIDRSDRASAAIRPRTKLRMMGDRRLSAANVRISPINLSALKNSQTN